MTHTPMRIVNHTAITVGFGRVVPVLWIVHFNRKKLCLHWVKFAGQESVIFLLQKINLEF